MPKNLAFLFCTALLAAWGASARAEANDGDHAELIAPTRIYGGAWFGFKGEAESEAGREFGGDLETTLGGQVGFEQVLWRHFSLGAEARLGASKWKENGDRTKLIDVDLKPRLRFPLRNTPIELYVAVPIGLTVPRDVRFEEDEAEERIGWNVGVGPGLSVFLTDWFGVNAEPIWLYHRFGIDRPEDTALELQQISVFVNGVLAL